MTLTPHTYKDMSAISDETLQILMLSPNASMEDKSAATAEYDRRKQAVLRRRDLWTRGIALLGLIIALTSLIWQILKELR